MRTKLLSLLMILIAFSCNNKNQISKEKMNLSYPDTRRDASVVEEYHGTKVADPYRWLEDDNSVETKAWVTQENALTFDYLSKIPSKSVLKSRMEKMWNYEKYSAPFKRGGKYYYYKNNGLQNQSVMYVQDNLDAPGVEVLNPNTLSKEGTVALGTVEFNKEGTMMAYQLSKAGSDWNTIYIKDLKNNVQLSDSIKWVKFSGISWKGDGFFYSRYPDPVAGKEFTGKSQFHKVCFHKVGTSQADDIVIFEDKNHPDYNFYGGVTDDERFLAISISESTSGNALYIKDLQSKAAEFIAVKEGFDSDYDLLENIGDNIFIATTDGAPNKKVFKMNIKNPEKSNWKVFIPEQKDVLSSVQFIGGKIFTNHMHNACSQIIVLNENGNKLQSFELPGIGTVGGFTGKREDNEAFYSFSSYTRPNTIYKLDVEKLVSSIFKAPKVAFDSDAYETKQVWYLSKDNVKVPMFITHKKGLKLDGTNPTLLYGYGGFNISMQPGFSVSRCVFMEQGGVYAVANLRGGGEFGESWHVSGTKAQKQNVFNDFIAAAEYLIQNKYTSSTKLAIQGGSNGGLLIGACMTQRPDLFRVCIPQVGVLDMLRYHKFTIGRAWSTDYGLSEKADEFKYLYAYSPLHNLKKTAYPATLVTTGDHDDRVVPAHSFKFAATLQHNQIGTSPTLIRIETSGGHGAGKPTTKVIDEASDILAFIFHNMGIQIK
jgi:prolyl oligopeptidase